MVRRLGAARAMLGSALPGNAIGLRATLWVSAVGGLLSVYWLVASPLRRARDVVAPAPVGTLSR